MNSHLAFTSHASAFTCKSNATTRKCSITATAREKPNTSTNERGVNINKYKSQRSIISADKRDLKTHEVNDLMVKAGKEVCHRTSLSELQSEKATELSLCLTFETFIELCD